MTHVHDVPWLELGVLGVVALAAGSVIASTLRLGISPMPSSGPARRAVLALVPPTVRGEVHELGCGWGGLAVALARHHPQARVIAWEASPLPWLVSALRARTVPNLQVRRGDFRHADLSGAEVLVCYLFTGGMRAVAEKLLRERPGAPVVIVSNTFTLRGWTPAAVAQVDDVFRTRVFRYDGVPPRPPPSAS